MTTERFSTLLQLYYDNALSEDELQEFLDAALDPANGQLFQDLIDARFQAGFFKGASRPGQADMVLARITLQSPEAKRAALQVWYRRRSVWWSAAAILVFASLMIIYPRHKRQQDVAARVVSTADPLYIPPGTHRATLTLSDGKILALDSSNTHLSVQQGDGHAKASGLGQLQYSQEKAIGTQPVVYNTIATPVGGTYQVQLPDGSRVWLNAASSLTFPTAFGPGPRQVNIQGEAYFEIAPDPSRPFSVIAAGTQVSVLGTSFNISAYADEPQQATTLITGKVRISRAGKSRELLPGQQVAIGAAGELTVRPVDTAQAVAWKNGFFDFQSAQLTTIMRSIEKWYDIQVEFKGAVGGRHFTGKFSRQDDASTMLHIMEESNIHFELKGKTLIISE